MTERMRVGPLLLGLALAAGCYDLEVEKPRDAGTTDSDIDTDIDTDVDSDTDSDSDTDTDSDCDPGWAGESCEICVRFVDPTVADGDYLAWETAGNHLPTAIQHAAGAVEDSVASSCEVWVVQGLYYIWESDDVDTVQLEPNVHVYGGFAGGETLREQRDFATNVTTLSAHAAYEMAQVFHTVTGANDATIDGFTITGGNADGTGLNGLGGGMFNDSCSPIVRNCTFTNNHAALGGGAMYNLHASPEIANCIFRDNLTEGEGGAILNHYGDPHLFSAVFAGNTADTGGGAIHNWSDSSSEQTIVVMSNCSFGDNSSGVELVGESHLNATNCIFHGNGDPELEATGGAGIELYWSLVEGGYTGDNVIDGDPLFADPGGGDLHVPSGSPCVDGGYFGTEVPETDLEGNPRVDDPGTENTGSGEPWVDMGAHEFQPE